MTKWVGLIVTGAIAISAGTASGQGIYQRGGYGVTSDFDAPYAALPPEMPLPPPRIYDPRYGGPNDGDPRYAPATLPPTAIYGILRDRGYSPLGVPQQRGFVYTISVISPDGDDGRLVIDARNGRILRFLPAYRMGDRMNNEITVSYGPVGTPPPIAKLNGMPPPVAMPRVASRPPGVPLPKPMPARGVAAPAQNIPPKPAVAATAKPADAQASIPQPAADASVPASPPAVIEAKPSVSSVIRPTQEMPPAQGFE